MPDGSDIDLLGAVEAAVQKALEDSAKAALPTDFLDATDLETMTGTPAATWRYWYSIGQGPKSFKLGRRRVWRRSDVAAWLEQQEAAV